jgi:branched-chain amino acid transport system ATP-binding protein
MLEVSGVRAGYGSGEILRGLTFTVAPGEIVAVVGVNGAGKSTTLKVISGLLRASDGHVAADGRRLSGGSTVEAVRHGIAHVPEGRQVFPGMTVRENLLLGAYTASKKVIAARMDTVTDVFPELSRRLPAYAGELSGGQQQMLAIGRGLMSAPRYLLLDEPSLGLAPQMCQRIFEVIARLGADGTGVLLVEQNGQLALAVAQQAFLLERDAITLSGTGAEMLANSEVAERYLGVGSASAQAAGLQYWTRALAAAMDEQPPRREPAGAVNGLPAPPAQRS